MKNKNILISGASVAGPSLAYWLNRYGFHPTIVERAPAVRPGGYAIDFRGKATRVVERMGVLDSIREVQTRTGKTTIVDSNNKELASLPDGFTSGEVEILRGDLAAILYEATKSDTEYIFDDSIAAISQDENGVGVTFMSGKTRSFDLVVGADGLHSKVRALAFGEESQFIRHLGYYVSIFTVPNHLDLDHSGLFYGLPGKMVGIFSAKDNAEAKASFYFASAPLQYDRYDVCQQKQMISDRFSSVGWEVPYLLEKMHDAPDFYFDSISQIKMDRWSAGRAVLLGDAAYCGSPLSGMGTGMAVVGAYILAGELKQADGDYRAAFAAYEKLMRDYVAKCQKIAEDAHWFVPQTRSKLWLRNQVWRMLPYSPWKNLMLEIPLKAANSIELKDY